MMQLVEVQHKRGAIGGETFIRVLDLQERAVPMDVETISVKKGNSKIICSINYELCFMVD